MSAAQFITVSSDAHSKMLVTGLWNHFLAKHKVDCNIGWKGSSIRVHRLLLDLFLSPGKATIPTDPASPLEPKKSSLDLMVEFLYQGRVLVHQEQFQGLLNVAKESNFQILVEAVQAAITLEKETAKIDEISPLNKDDELDNSDCLSLGLDEKSGNGESAIEHSSNDPPTSANEDDQVHNSEAFTIEAEEEVLKLDTSKTVANRPLRRTRKTKPLKLVTRLRNGGSIGKNTINCVPAKLESSIQREKTVPDLSNNDSTNSTDLVNESAPSSPQIKDALGLDEPSLAGDRSKSPISVAKTNKSNRKRIAGPPYTCTECQKTFSCSSSLSKHNMIHLGLKPFPCKVCGHAFRVRRTLLDHQRSVHSQERPFCCDVCGKTFSFKKNMEQHKRTHTGERPYQCKVESCGKTFNSTGQLKIHHQVNHVTEKTHQCGQCPLSFKLRKSLEAHQLRHTDIRAFKCDHEGCKKAFHTSASLQYHKKSHSSVKPHVCKVCGKTFRFKVLLGKHAKRHGLTTKEFSCVECQKAFLTKGELTVHSRVHSTVKACQCEICGLGLCSAYRLKEHMRSHSQERPYKCKHCDKKFTTGGSLRSHVVLHAEKRFQCSLCPRMFHHRQQKVRHEKGHEKGKLPQFRCNVCSEGFDTQFMMEDHSVQHIDDYPYQCTVCFKQYAKHAQLKEHARSHAKTFHCVICNKTFANRSGFYKHRKKFHANVAEPSSDDSDNDD